MADIKKEHDPSYANLLDKIQSIETRLNGIESYLGIEWAKDPKRMLNKIAPEDNGYTAEATESKIVEYGLAWLGSIVFLLGIIFLMNYTESLGHVVLSRGIAYLATILLIAIAYYLRNSFPILVNVLNICGISLLYYITLRLHFFSDQPLIQQKSIGLFLLFILIGVQFLIGAYRKFEFQAAIAVMLCTMTAIFSDSAYITLSIITITSIIALILFYQNAWWRLLIFSLFMVYLTHLIWLFGNPIMDHQMRIVADPNNNILFLFAQGIIYAVSIFIATEKIKSNGVLISTAIWNALFFSFLLLLTTLSFYKENYGWIFGAIALFCILYAVLLKIKEIRKFAPATYACFGFVAFSVAVYGFSGLPETYLLLALQSLLVVTMALWFRSQIIVVANSILFVSILLIYLTTSPSINNINFAFAFVALATARILNWKKERLTLKTEVFRNVYLFVVFFMVLFSLSHALPSQYVTLAWTAAAIGFFILSILLRKIKYRWISILTIIVTGGHLFFIDLAQMEIGYRVIAFLVFAIISLGVSLYYTKRIRKSTK